MTETLVSQLTLNDLRDLIRVEIKQALLEVLGDPDEGLELREAIKQRWAKEFVGIDSPGQFTHNGLLSSLK